MNNLTSSVLSLAALAAASTTVAAEPAIIATAPITVNGAASDSDLSGLTVTLENGLPANILGGFGSGVAYAGNGVMVGLPDRGPNATVYNSKIDDTVTFIPRLDEIVVKLVPAANGAVLPFSLTADLVKTTLLWSAKPLVYGSGTGLDVPNGAPKENAAQKFYFSGRSDDFDPAQNSCATNDARLDPESIRVSNDGKTVYVSDEYGPYLHAFDRATGERVSAFELPSNLCVPSASEQKQLEIEGNTVGRTTNKGMEGIAITPDGKTLVGVMQAPLLQDEADKATAKLIRIVTVDIASGATHEYGYKLTDGSGVSDVIAVNDHEFLMDERKGNGLGDGTAAKVKKLFKIDLAGATDITDLNGQAAADAAVNKTEFFDLLAELGKIGVAPEQVPSKIEGLAFGPDVTQNGQTLHTLFISNDNDFLPEDAGPNLFYVVGFTDADLPGFQPQQIAR